MFNLGLGDTAVFTKLADGTLGVTPVITTVTGKIRITDTTFQYACQGTPPLFLTIPRQPFV